MRNAKFVILFFYFYFTCSHTLKSNNNEAKLIKEEMNKQDVEDTYNVTNKYKYYLQYIDDLFNKIKTNLLPSGLSEITILFAVFCAIIIVLFVKNLTSNLYLRIDKETLEESNEIKYQILSEKADSGSKSLYLKGRVAKIPAEKKDLEINNV